MPETRRELFRTTVAAAIGVTAGAVGGVVAAETFLAPQPAAPGSAATVIAVYDTVKKVWYLFHFEGDRQKCRLFSTGTTPPVPDTSKIDTTTWFAVSRDLIIQPTTITYTKGDGTSGTIDVEFDADGYVADGTPNSSLQKLLALLTFTPAQIPGSWYEIGKRN